MESYNLFEAEYNFIFLTALCKNVITLPLIDILTHYIVPFKLYMKIKSCSTLITGKQKLRQDQLKCCFIKPPIAPNYTKFDFPLIYKLIKHLCPSLRPTREWGIEPRSMDTLIGDDIERLRLLYSYFSACPRRMYDGKLQVLLKNIKSVFHRFQNFTKRWSTINYVQKIDKIAQDVLGCEDLEKDNQLLKLTLILLEQPEDKGKQIFNNAMQKYLKEKFFKRRMQLVQHQKTIR